MRGTSLNARGRLRGDRTTVEDRSRTPLYPCQRQSWEFGADVEIVLFLGRTYLLCSST